MHPKDTLEMVGFREEYGQVSLVLPTDVWHSGLRCPGDRVDFEVGNKPYSIELVSVGEEYDGYIPVVLKINNQTRVFSVETPRVVRVEVRMAQAENEVGSPISGNVWRIGNPSRGTLSVGNIIHEGEEIANIEAMKMENAIVSPFDGRISEVCVGLNNSVIEGQLLFVLDEEGVQAAREEAAREEISMEKAPIG